MLVVAILVGGCGQEEMRIPLQEVESSPGGTVPTLKVVEHDDQPRIVAPVGDRLFVREAGDDRWRARRVRWPASVEQPGLEVFETLRRASLDRQVGPEHYFGAVDGRLWTVASPGAGHEPRLLHSDNLGRSFNEVGLPEDFGTAKRRPGPSAASTPAMRVVATDDALFVTDGRGLWRAGDPAEIEEGLLEIEWEAVSLEGVELGDRSGDEAEKARLPANIHHYRPAGDDHDYELLTVYGRQLQVYRRDEGDEAFRRVSTLDAVDRDLVRDTERNTWFVVDPEGLYRSDDRGETWTHIEVKRDSLEPENLRRLVLRETGEGEAEEPDLWLVGEAGGLWRSTDRGEEWRELRGRDGDGRALTTLVFDRLDSPIWAASEGRGILRSDDGVQWIEANQGLEVAEVRDATLWGIDRLLVGTDAGLFERSNTDPVGGWSRIDERATTALYAEDDGERIVAGTVGGRVDLYVGGDKRESAELAPVDHTGELEFRPPYFEGQQLPETAVLEIVSRPDSPELVAWSHRRGAMVSSDDGETWRPLGLGDAFRHAVADSVVTHFLAMRDQTYFAATRPRRPNQPSRLWRSDDGGSTWQTTYSIRDDVDETPIQLVRLPDDQGLVMAHGSRVAASTDRGETWSTVSGPWESGVVTGLAVDGEQVAVIMNLPHASEIAFVDDPAGSASVDRRHRLGWPPTRMLNDHRPVDAEVRGDKVLVRDRETTYRGQTPRRATGRPASASMVIALGAVIALVTLAFGYLRRWETEG